MTDNSKFFGLNKGAAQVIDTSPLLNQFGQMLAKQQAQRQLELKQLTDQQAQLKPDGLRNDADRKDFFNQANDWRQKSINAMNERDPYKKSLLQSQAQQAYMQAQSTVNQSKQQAAKDLAFNQFAMNDATRHQLTDDAVTKGLANAEVGVNDPRLIKEYSSLGRQVDHKKIIDQFDAADKDALKQSPWGTPTLKDMTVAGRKATFINNSRTLDPNDRAQMYGQMYDTQRDVKKFFNDVYPQFYNDPNLSPEQQKQAAIGQYIKDAGDVSEYSAPQEKAGLAPKEPSWLEGYYLKHYGVPYNPNSASQQSNAPTYFQDLSERIRNEGKPKDDKSGALAELNQQVSQNPEYLLGVAYDWSNPKAVRIIVPAKYKYDPKAVSTDDDGKVIPNSGRVITKPSYPTVLDSTNPDQWTAGFARIYKDLTGDQNANPTKAMTPYGKGHVPGGQSMQQAKQKKVTDVSSIFTKK